MAKWQIALALLVAAVALHVFGVVRQIRHYRQVFAELSTRWRGQRIGTGAAGGGLAILVADEAGLVLAARLRLGAGSFARFEPRPDLVGLSLPEVAARAAASAETPADKALAAAVADLERQAGARHTPS